MSKISTAINLLKHNRSGFFAQILMKMSFLFPDKLYLSMLYRLEMGKWIDWKNPRTFTEKLQWLKLYDFKPEYTKMVDKYAVKEYVASIIGKQYIIPTLGVWDRVEDIDWDSLPDQFVLKTTHGGGGGGVVICQDKSKFDRRAAEKKLSASMRANAGKTLREKPYLKVPRRIIAEKYMADSSRLIIGDLVDYKFYCFNGEPKLVMVADGRNSGNKRFGYYDLDWNPVKITWGAPRPEVEFEEPSNLGEMLKVASELSRDLVHARIDLYNIEDKVYFGEITFFDGSGLTPIEPEDYDNYLGCLMKLPKVRLRGGKVLIINEKYICKPFESDDEELTDYKFYCFDGQPRYCQVIRDRHTEETIDFYDMEWNHMPFVGLNPVAHNGLTPVAHNGLTPVARPAHLDIMMNICCKLSKVMKFSRIDLYEINGNVYFGEITFYPAGGFGEFTPDDWNVKLGDLIHLDGVSCSGKCAEY